VAVAVVQARFLSRHLCLGTVLSQTTTNPTAINSGLSRDVYVLMGRNVCVRASVRVCTHAHRVCTCVSTCVRVQLRARVRTCVRISVRFNPFIPSINSLDPSPASPVNTRLKARANTHNGAQNLT
jgi:hypothetical protein